MSATSPAGRRLVLASFSAVLAFTAACDDGPAADGGSSPKLDTSQVETYDAFIQRLSESYCDHLVVPCCADAKPITRDDCVSLLRPDLKEELLDDGGGAYVPQLGAACVAAVDRVTCGQKNDPGLDACEHVFDRVARPGKAPLEPCTTNAECGAPAKGRASCEGGACSSNGGCTPSRCSVEIEVAAGEACSSLFSGGPNDPPPGPSDGTYRLCPRGLLCDRASLVCTPVPKVGEPCDIGCASGAICNAGVCRASLPDGAVCAEQYECASFACENGVCVARPGAMCPLGTDSTP